MCGDGRFELGHFPNEGGARINSNERSGGFQGAAKMFPLSEAADAVRHLIEDRPFGRVLMRVGD